MTEKNSLRREILDWVKTIALAVIFAAIINYFGGIAVVRGESMMNTLQNKDVLILEKMTYKKDIPTRGDVIAFKTKMSYPSGIYKMLGYKKNLVKRVIGIPGDHILIENGILYLNDEKMEESYIKDGIVDVNKPFDGIVPEGHIFAMGDNRLNSNDSRTQEVGYILIEDVIGKAFVRVYPFNNTGRI